MSSVVICSVKNKILVEKCNPVRMECPVRDMMRLKYPVLNDIAYLTACLVAWEHSFSTNIKSLTGLQRNI